LVLLTCAFDAGGARGLEVDHFRGGTGVIAVNEKI
jgi:hypothetical protein